MKNLGAMEERWIGGNQRKGDELFKNKNFAAVFGGGAEPNPTSLLI